MFGSRNRNFIRTVWWKSLTNLMKVRFNWKPTEYHTQIHRTLKNWNKNVMWYLHIEDNKFPRLTPEYSPSGKIENRSWFKSSKNQPLCVDSSSVVGAGRRSTKSHTTEGGHLKTRLHRVRMVSSSSSDFFTCSSNQLCNTVATKPPSAVTEGREKNPFSIHDYCWPRPLLPPHTTTDSRGSTNTLCCRCTCVGTQSRVRSTDVACVYWWPLYTPPHDPRLARLPPRPWKTRNKEEIATTLMGASERHQKKKRKD